MASKKIKDLPLLSKVSGTEKIPTGGFGDNAVSISQIKNFTLDKAPILDFTHKESVIGFDVTEDETSQMTLNLDTGYSYRFYNPELTEQLNEVTKVVVNTTRDGLYNIVLDFEAMFSPLFSTENVFAFEPQLPPTFDFNKEYFIFLIKYLKVGTWEQAEVTLRTKARSNPVTNLCDNPITYYERAGDSDGFTMSNLKVVANDITNDRLNQNNVSISQYLANSSTNEYRIRVANKTTEKLAIKVYFGGDLVDEACLAGTV